MLRGARKIQCSWCGVTFWVGRCDGKKHDATCCSRRCSGLARGNGPTKTPTAPQIAWAAGFYEGEGTVVTIGRSNVMVEVGQKDRWPLDLLVAWFGGVIRHRHAEARPNASIPIRVSTEWYAWRISGPRAARFLLIIFPFLSPHRRDQIRSAYGRRVVQRQPEHVDLGRQLASREALELDIAWAAGIFEGEGSTNRTANSSVVRISQKSPWILSRIREMFGGHLGYYAIYAWQACGDNARRFLMAVMPYLSPRRRLQVDRALGVAA